MTLDARLAALRRVHELGEGRLPQSRLDELAALLERADQRRTLSAEHTVVGLFGATGSGKSSLLNALVGEEIARAHVRRPTTAEPLAVSWDAAGAAPLLDWLAVHDRHERAEPIDPRAAKLILLDLPDFDSVETAHRAIAERLAEQVDALVWVVDPQKYADAVLHTEFLARHARHGSVTLVVLNQVDLLAEAEVPRVVSSLQQLLAGDGLTGVRVLSTSAVTGHGIRELREAIGALAAARTAQTVRLEADVITVAASIEAPGSPGKASRGAQRELTERLGSAAGAEKVADAVAASYRKRSGQATGWPLVSWISRLRADPLTRLGLRRPKGADPELHRTSMPALGAAALAEASLAVRGYAEAASEGLSEAWRAPVREAATDAVAALPPRLDLAIARAPLPTGRSWWWPVLTILQVVALLAALGGVLWLLGIAFLPAIPFLPGFGLRAEDVPVIEGWPLTTLLIAGGVLLGIVLGLLAGIIAAAVAARRRRRARAALRKQVSLVAEELAVAPVAAQLDRARDFAAALDAAAG